MLKSCVIAAAFSAGLVFLGSATVSAQEYPNKPIRIVTSAAGGGNDFASRLIATGIAGPLGQPVIVDNRASTPIAIELASKALPDGYSVLINGTSNWIRPLVAKMPWDPIRDFAPVTLLVKDASVVVVNPALPVKSIKELIAFARSRPGSVNYGSTGVGGPAHLAAELFKSMAAVNLVHIPYKGTAPALVALMGNEIQVFFTDAGGAAPHVKSGKIRALAVTTIDRSSLLPELPTVASAGLPGYEATGMICVFVPAKTPTPIISRLNQEIVRVLQLHEIKDKFLAVGAETVGSTPQELAAIIKADMANMEKVIREAGIRAD